MRIKNTDWNPSLYLKFGRERLQPTVDLASRVELDSPGRIIDIGCGPGNSTAVLRGRWPDAEIAGLDSSPAMIEQARAGEVRADWILADASTDPVPGHWDLVFSNAAYQWMPDHAGLFARLKEALSPEGCLAAQIPLFNEMPMNDIIEETADQVRWGFARKDYHFTIHSREEYYDILAGLFARVDLWVTDYVHVMDSPDAVLEMMRSTGLKPYLSQLEGDMRETYENEILKGIEREYPRRSNGRVLYPFKRLFFAAYN